MQQHPLAFARLKRGVAMFLFVALMFTVFRTSNSALLKQRKLSFSPSLSHSRLHSMKSSLQMSAYGSDNEAKDPFRDISSNKKFLKTLLTFQAVKTFMYYSEEFHDEVTVKWLNNFDKQMGEKEEESRQQIAWNQYLGNMMRTPPEEIHIKKIQQRARGGSGTNPYISNEHVYEFTVKIDPFSLGKRLMAIRENLANEWSSDLELVGQTNEEMQRNHLLEMINGEEGAVKFQKAIFESDPFGASTPYRTANFDLLNNMITTIALRRLETEVRIGGNAASRSWIEEIIEETKEMKHEEQMKYILKGPLSRRVQGRSEVGEKMVQLVMSFREQAAFESIITLQETKEDHNMMIREFLNERLKDQMSAADLLEYQLRELKKFKLKPNSSSEELDEEAETDE